MTGSPIGADVTACLVERVEAGKFAEPHGGGTLRIKQNFRFGSLANDGGP